MNLCKELRETACDAGNGLDRESRDAIYEAAEMFETMQWQPIVSAPKDGSPVMLYFPKRYQGKGGISWGCFLHGDWLDSRAIRDNDASHWMPMPAHPPLPNGDRA